MYSIIDIETTGNHALQHDITEIAIINFDGEKITDKFCTLIRPESYVPYFISHLTGITDGMVEDAPSFEDVAEQIEEFTRDRIMIAHNAHFDYTFLKHAFQRIGKSFQRKTLCTLHLTKKIIPGLPSYSLHNLCRALNVTQKPTHRAEPDALAALEVFMHLQIRDKFNVIASALRKRNAESNYPPNLSREILVQLPEAAGVYYFLDQHGNILYVGKAKNLKHRIHSHFGSNSSTRARTRLMNQIHHLNYSLAGNELVAMLMESAEIKKHFPPFNYAQKIAENNFGLYCYEDGKGYHRFGLKKLKTLDRPLASFSSLIEARSFLTEQQKAFHLCPKLCGLQKSLNECFGFHAGNCDGACCGKVEVGEYNGRVKAALETFKSDSRSYAIIGNGRSGEECSVVLLEDGKYLGFGFIEKESIPSEFSDIKTRIQFHKDNREVQGIIQSYLRSNSDFRVVYPS